MKITKKIARGIKKYCGADCRVCEYTWEGKDESSNEGYNALCAPSLSDLEDVVDCNDPDYLIGQDIPDRQGFLLLEMYLYGKRDGGLIGNRECIVDSRGEIIWRSHHPSSWYDARGDQKVGDVVARHFGVIEPN